MNLRLLFCSFIAALSWCAVAGTTTAQQVGSWGALKGRFVFGGDAPKPVTLDIERDAGVCGKVGLVDESLVVRGGSGAHFAGNFLKASRTRSEATSSKRGGSFARLF